MAINDTQILLGNVVRNYWKLKTIGVVNSLGVANIYMPKEEGNKSIQRMIGNQQIKNLTFNKGLASTGFSSEVFFLHSSLN
jgi:hypothetical protein